MKSYARYQSIRRVAEGSASEITLARQRGIGGVERLVILKRLRPDLSEDGAFRDAFLKSAYVAAALDHPHLLTVFDVEAPPNDAPALVMEYVSGETLGAIRDALGGKGGGFPLHIACRVIADIAGGLAYALKRGGGAVLRAPLTHGTLTPRGVMISYEGVCKLLDFGLLERPEAHQQLPSRCVAYAAPERLEGPATPTADVFSMGVILHELLTGERLFKGPDPVAEARAVRKAKIRPPSAARPEVPACLDAITLDALARKPAKRIQSPDALRARLEDALREMRLGVSPFGLSEWVRGVMGLRYEARLKMERGALKEARAREEGAAEALPSLDPFANAEEPTRIDPSAAQLLALYRGEGQALGEGLESVEFDDVSEDLDASEDGVEPEDDGERTALIQTIPLHEMLGVSVGGADPDVIVSNHQDQDEDAREARGAFPVFQEDDDEEASTAILPGGVAFLYDDDPFNEEK